MNCSLPSWNMIPASMMLEPCGRGIARQNMPFQLLQYRYAQAETRRDHWRLLQVRLRRIGRTGK